VVNSGNNFYIFELLNNNQTFRGDKLHRNIRLQG